MSKCVIGLVCQPGIIKITDVFNKTTQLKIQLPEGCLGISYIFKSKKAAKKWFGNKIKLQEIEFEESCH